MDWVGRVTQPPLLDHDPAGRRPFDFYETPAWMTLALLRRVKVAGPVLEPAAGNGAIVRVLQKAGHQWWSNDLDQTWPTQGHADITQRDTWRCFPEWNWAVTNLPFNVADQVVPIAHAFMLEDGGLAFLLRLSWLEPTAARQDFLNQYPPKRLIVLPRHDFRGSGQTDSVTSAWMVWGHVEPGIEVVTKAERDALGKQDGQ